MTHQNPADAVREALYLLRVAVSPAGADFSMCPDLERRIESFIESDRLAALAGAAPVAWMIRQKNGLSVGPVFRDKTEADECPVFDRELDELIPLFTHAPAKARGVAEADVERAAKAMAEHDGWHGWDTAIGCNDTLGGNTPDEEREHYRDIARVALATFAEGSE